MTAPALPPLRIDYGDPLGEARACRSRCALFDFSFVHRARVHGPRVVADLEAFCSRTLGDLQPGRIRYALRCDADAAVVADLTVWRIDPLSFEVMSGRARDISDLRACCAPSTEVEDRSGDAAIFALQGPSALRVLAPLTDSERLARVPYYGFATGLVAGVECLLGRLGYSGERGFEVLVPSGHAPMLWETLAARARPAGFAAIDMLRIEAGFMLFAHECLLRPSAAELGLATLVNEPAPAPRMRLVCFRADAREKPLAWHPPTPLRRPVPGTITVTSASWSVHADAVLGLGFVPAAEHGIGRRPRASVAGFENLELVPMAWIDPAKTRPRGPWPEVGGLDD